MRERAIAFLALVIFSLSVESTAKAADFAGASKSIVSSLNTVSEIYNKPVILNGDVILIASVTCSEFLIARNTGNAQAISDAIAQYRSKNPDDEAYKEVSAEALAHSEREFFAKMGATDLTQDMISRQIADSYRIVSGQSEGAVAHQQIEKAACEIKDTNIGDPKEAANEKLLRLARAFTNGLVGLAVATIDIAVAADTGLAGGVVAFVSTSWAWDHINGALEEVKAAWESLTGKKLPEPTHG
jgi:hypothetical protein